MQIMRDAVRVLCRLLLGVSASMGIVLDGAVETAYA